MQAVGSGVLGVGSGVLGVGLSSAERNKLVSRESEGHSMVIDWGPSFLPLFASVVELVVAV